MSTAIQCNAASNLLIFRVLLRTWPSALLYMDSEADYLQNWVMLYTEVERKTTAIIPNKLSHEIKRRKFTN